MMHEVEISTFVGTEAFQSNIVDSVEKIDFDDLGKILVSKMYSPFLFKDKKRFKNNFVSTVLLVLDFDGGMTLVEAEGVISDFNLKAIVGKTKSHTDEQNRFRIIFPLVEKITNEADYEATWKAAAFLFPACDKACKDVARFYFPCKEIVGRYDGSLFNVSRCQKIEDKKKPEWKPRYQTQRGRLYLNTMQFIVDPPKAGEWHSRFIAAAFNLKENMYTIEEARAYLKKATGHLDDTDEKQLLDIYENRTAKPINPPPAVNQISSKKFTRPSYTESMEEFESGRSRQNIRNENKLPFICDVFDTQFDLMPGTTLIAGPTGKGKSTVSANIVARVLQRGQKDALVIVNEETLTSVLGRVACINLGLNYNAFYKGFMVEDRTKAVDAEILRIIPRVTVMSGGKGWNTNLMEDVVRLIQNIEEDSQGIGVVIIDYLQMVSESEVDGKEGWQISKDFGKFLVGFGQRTTFPLVVFAQIKSKSNSPEFSERIQNNKTFVNNVDVAIEMVANIEEKTTKFIFHKDRFGDMAGKEVIAYFNQGKFSSTPEAG